MGKSHDSGSDGDDNDMYASLLYQGNDLRQFALRNGSLFRMWHLMQDVDPRRCASKRLRYTRRSYSVLRFDQSGYITHLYVRTRVTRWLSRHVLGGTTVTACWSRLDGRLNSVLVTSQRSRSFARRDFSYSCMHA